MTPEPKTEIIDPIAPSPPAPIRRANFWLTLAFFLFLWGVLCRYLGAEWTINDQYNYGWFVPFFAAYLFWTRWETRPRSRATASDHRLRFSFLIGGAALLLLVPLRLFEVGNPDWRLLGWLHALVAATLTLLALWCVGGKQWIRHFAFPLGFFFVAVPWLLTFEVPLVQLLMRVVAMGASEAATLCGIPAEFEGNLIRINSGVVGVNEACSGVRSLQTSLMIGLLFGDLWRLTTSRRILLVAGALAIALVANFARAFFLVWVAADQGLPAVDRWHNVAGYFIFGTVCLGSILLAAILGRRQGKTVPPPAAAEDAPREVSTAAALPNGLLIGALSWLVLVEVGVEAWYRVHERSLSAQVPWTVQWPAPEGAKAVPIDDGVARILRFDEGGTMEWQLPSSSTPSGRALLFFFRWAPGSTSIIRARGHRPDICLPSTGWRIAADHGLRYYAAGADLSLPFRHYSFVHDRMGQRAAFAHAFFCIHESRVRKDASATADVDPTSMQLTRWMMAERARVVLEGLRNPGQQVLELIITSRTEIPSLEAEAKFAEMLPSLVRIGDGGSSPLTSR
jgi:exosortase